MLTMVAVRIAKFKYKWTPIFELFPICREKPEWAQAEKIDVGASSVHPKGPQKGEGMKVNAGLERSHYSSFQSN